MGKKLHRRVTIRPDLAGWRRNMNRVVAKEQHKQEAGMKEHGIFDELWIYYHPSLCSPPSLPVNSS